MADTERAIVLKSWREIIDCRQRKFRERLTTSGRTQHNDAPHLFVDRNLSDNDLILALRAFEFTVTSYYDYYTKDRVPDPQLVPDEDIISECSAKSWVLVTADKNLEYRHFLAIKNSKISIFIVPDNCI